MVLRTHDGVDSIVVAYIVPRYRLVSQCGLWSRNGRISGRRSDDRLGTPTVWDHVRADRAVGPARLTGESGHRYG